MSADHDAIHSLVARHLTEPLVRHVTAESEGVDKAFVDKLGTFAAFIAKVRHNQVRPQLPRTFEFLRSSNLEGTFFRTYEPSFQRRRSERRFSPREQFEEFVAALQLFLKYSSYPQASHGADLLAHEISLFRLLEQVSENETSSSAGSEIEWAGRVATGIYDLNFVHEQLGLVASPVGDGDIKGGLIYFRPNGSHEVSLLAASTETISVLELLNAGTSLRSFLAAAGTTLQSEAREMLERLLIRLTELGIVASWRLPVDATTRS